MTEKSAKTILIVGGGLAGVSAALEIASQNSAKIIMIESQKSTGGNSAKAVSGINGCVTAAQERHEIRAGRHENDEKMVHTLVEKADEAFKFLFDHDVSLNEVNLGGGHSVARTHCLTSPKRDTPNVEVFGARMMKALFAKLDDYSAKNRKEGRKDWIKLLTSTRAEELLVSGKDPNRVVGVKIRTAKGRSENLKADAVILACGGFCNDHSKHDSLLTQYRPDLEKYPSTNGDFADGSGIKMALKLGADVVGMNRVQVHPTGFVNPKDPKSKTKPMCPEALRGFGGILVNKEGRRFANELELRENFVALIEKNCEVDPNCGFKTAYLIVNDEIVENFGRSSFDIYLKKGLAAANLEELSKMSGIPYKNLKATFDDEDQCFLCEKSDDFGKTIFPVQFDVDQILYFCQTTPSIHYTFGGLKVDESCRVLTTTDRQAIEGLYAVGETAGGTHGAERLSGNSLLECVVFGRLAAQEATKN